MTPATASTGIAELIQQLDAAVAQADDEIRCRNVKRILSETVAAGGTLLDPPFLVEVEVAEGAVLYLGDGLEGLERLRARHPGCYRFLFDFGLGGAFLGASPERLVTLRGVRVASDAIAGTAARPDAHEKPTAAGRTWIWRPLVGRCRRPAETARRRPQPGRAHDKRTRPTGSRGCSRAILPLTACKRAMAVAGWSMA